MPQAQRSETRRAIEPTQREVLREVMLAAAECGTWLTLDEVTRLTRYPQASISAQLRHLRKPRHGAFVVEKKRRVVDELADFALAGQAALGAPERASRMVMFRMYYLGLAPYDNARHFLGLSERSWVNWSEEIRRRCGDELLRRSMFPPRKYFSEMSV